MACLFATIAAGLLVHRRGAALGATVRDVAGDALWATMMVWWVALLLPQRPVMVRAALAYGICVLVEMSQLVQWPPLDAIRATALGRLVLGSDFDPRDLAAYAAGIIVALLLQRLLLPPRNAQR